MKRIYKNNEKKQRVRILATGELGTVTDRVLMKRSGTPMLYYQVKLDSQPNLDRWYWADQLGDTKERCRVTFEHESGQALIYDFEMDHEKNRVINMTMTGRNPENLMGHRGLHVLMASHMLEGFTAKDVEVE